MYTVVIDTLFEDAKITITRFRIDKPICIDETFGRKQELKESIAGYWKAATSNGSTLHYLKQTDDFTETILEYKNI